MEYDNEAQAVNFISGLLLGVVIGAGIALLTAPQPGRRARRKIQRTALELRDSAADRWDHLADDVRDKVDEAIRGARKKYID